MSVAAHFAILPSVNKNPANFPSPGQTRSGRHTAHGTLFAARPRPRDRADTVAGTNRLLIMQSLGCNGLFNTGISKCHQALGKVLRTSVVGSTLGASIHLPKTLPLTNRCCMACSSTRWHARSPSLTLKTAGFLHRKEKGSACQAHFANLTISNLAGSRHRGMR